LLQTPQRHILREQRDAIAHVLTNFSRRQLASGNCHNFTYRRFTDGKIHTTTHDKHGNY
jgi:hypothetical protein